MTARDLRDDSGAVLATAIITLMIMLGLGLAVVTMSDTQTRQSGHERTREARFDLAESALNDEIFDLSRNWPATAAGAYPDCTTSSTTATTCPLASQLLSNFTGADFKNVTAWTVAVRDDGGASGSYYDDSVTPSQPHWDANGDGQVWIRAQGWIGNPGQSANSRVLIARVKVEQVPVTFPNAPFVAGAVGTSNSGNKTIIDGQGKPGIVRCTTAMRSDCLDYSVNKGQIPDGVTQDTSTDPNLLTPEILDALRQTAKANGTYDTGCPADPNGKVVFVEAGDCSYNNSTIKNGVNTGYHNSIFVIDNGTLHCNGNIQWYGIIYLVNAQNSSGSVFDNSGGGGCTIHGGVYIDGNGKLDEGSSGLNLIYDSNVVLNTTAYGTAGIVQNTWRELTIPR
jgi:hypothetical protein